MSIENTIKETRLIKQHFSFLFEREFSIIHAEPARHFNNWLLEMASPSLRIQFAEDRSELIIRIGPRSAGIGWQGSNLWDLQLLVFHLTKDFDATPRSFFTKNIEDVSKIFHKYRQSFSGPGL